jgi:hypothetical protein
MTDTIVAECGCKVCVGNAASLGLPAPLRATVPAHLLTVCKGKAHSLVYIAHQPGAYGAALRDTTGIRPLTGGAS